MTLHSSILAWIVRIGSIFPKPVDDESPFLAQPTQNCYSQSTGEGSVAHILFTSHRLMKYQTCKMPLATISMANTLHPIP